ncbi:MAG: leucine-rich repeat domain-containing protein [Oscillospiraceae bacterium]|nr:leucine-rich repeat domain-containing protein [Oscillospiraceae bacterium]
MYNSSFKLHSVRRLAALVLALMLAAGVAMPVLADGSGSCGDGVSWSLSDGQLTISGKGAMTDFSEENMPPWFESAAEITSIKVGEGVTHIGAQAFYGFRNLSSVSLPSTVRVIGERAFKECTSLGHIKLPAGLSSIRASAFESCKALNSVHLPDGLRSIGDAAFYRCYALASISIPASVEHLGSVVFAYCSNLVQATIKCPLGRLPDWTFYGCKKLNAVVLPETVSSAGEYAFYECEQLEDIYYTGVSQKELSDNIQNGGNSAGFVSGEYNGAGSASENYFDESGSVNTNESTTIVETDNSLVLKEVTTETSYEVNGEKISVEELSQTESGEEVIIDTHSKTNVSIESSVNNSEGWDELAQEVDKTLVELKEEENKQVEITVFVPEAAVGGADLSKVIEKGVVVNISTPENVLWRLDGDYVSAKDVAKKDYNFSVTVTEAKVGKIDSDVVYKVKFAEDAAFPVTVGIRVGHAYQLATLYMKNGFSYDEMHTVIIDGNGMAWITLPEVQKKATYYIGVDVEGKTQQDAVIPASLYEKYGLTEETVATLTDSHGNYYEVGERTSAWGITAGEFALYIGIALGVIILIVSLAMFTLNKIRKDKEKYQVEKPKQEENYDDDDDDDDDLLDEDELRMQIMRELLEEAQNGGLKDD